MAEHPDYRLLLTDIVERHGGVGRFSPVQREVAGQIAQLMIDMRSAAPGDYVRYTDVQERLMQRLPPVVDPSRRESNRITRDMSLHEAASAYARMIADLDPRPDEYEAWTTDDLPRNSPVIDGTVNPPVPATRTAPASARSRALPNPTAPICLPHPRRLRRAPPSLPSGTIQIRPMSPSPH
jgi:hypothetical protein